ncbi:MAG: hypothetical protein KF894_05690 [Labilithrix sp.]|nr:hypothetical protein [Labilithrix sp.]
MSGTRKMEKFEVDAYTKGREDARALSQGEPLESQAAAAIADLQPNAVLDALVGPDAAGPAASSEPRVAGTDLPRSRSSRAPPWAGRASGPARGAVRAARRGPRAATPRRRPLSDAGVPGSQAVGAAAGGGAGRSGATPEGSRDPEALRTRLAQKFVSLADSVTEAFRDFAIGAGAYAVELTAPQGMSTGGGKQALQHLRLRPRREGYAVLVAGTVNQVERRAELRDYDHMAIMNDVRFRATLDISLQEWEQFLRKAEVVLNGAGIQSMRTPPPRELLEQSHQMRRVSKRAIAALVVVLLLAAVVVWRVVVALGAE